MVAIQVAPVLRHYLLKLLGWVFVKITTLNSSCPQESHCHRIRAWLQIGALSFDQSTWVGLACTEAVASGVLFLLGKREG